MGKSQKKRAMRRHNPIRVPDSHLPPGLAAAESTSTKKDAILPILQKIESPDATDRAFACAAISNLIYNDPSTRRLLQGKNIVGILITRLTDSVDEVVAESAGALRNLCIDGGYDICAEMYNKDILTPLQTFIPKISAALTTFLNTPNATAADAPKLAYQLAENLITLFWCLSETSNKALNAINNISLIPFLMGFMDAQTKLPGNLVAASAQCLYVLSDDNSPAIAALRSEGSYVSCLMNTALPPSSENTGADNEQLLTLRVLSSGILKNISPLPPMTQAAAVDLDQTVILPLLTPILSYSLAEASNTVYTIASQPIEKALPQLKNTPKADHKTPGEIELERIENQLRTVQLALEILTGVCAKLPDPEPDEEEGPSKPEANGVELDLSNEDGDDDDGDDAMETVEEDDESPIKGTEASLLSALTPPLLALATPTQLSFPPPSLTSVHPPTTSALGTIHVRALECLNNLFMNLDGEGDAQVIKGVSKVWGDLWNVLVGVGKPSDWMGGVAVVGGQEKRVEMWAVAVGVLWGLARVGKGTLVPDAEQVKVLMEVCDTTTDEGVKVQCIGTLGCLAQCKEAVEANKIISAYLIATPFPKTPTASPEPALQAINVLIDIYSDEDAPYDINFRTSGFLAQLKALLPTARRAVKAIDVRKKNGNESGGRALRTWGDGVVRNLKDFIAYREGLRL